MPHRLVRRERPAVPHRRRRPAPAVRRRARPPQSRCRPSASADDHAARQRTAGRRGVGDPVARVEAAEPAGAGVQPLLERGVQRPGARRAAVARRDHLGLARRGTPNARGTESATSCTVRCTASPASRTGTITTSLPGASTWFSSPIADARRPARRSGPGPACGRRPAGSTRGRQQVREDPARARPSRAPAGRRSAPAGRRPAATPPAARRSPRPAAARPARPAGRAASAPSASRPGPSRAGQQPGDGDDRAASRSPASPSGAGQQPRPAAAAVGVCVAAQARRPSARAAASSAAGSARAASPPVCSTSPCPATARISSAADGDAAAAHPAGRRPRRPRVRAVLCGHGVDQPGQPVGEALLGERVAVQAEQHLTGRRSASSPSSAPPGAATPPPASRRGRPGRPAPRPASMAVLHGLVRVGHRRAAAEAPGERGRLQRGVPGQGGLLQQPADERPGAPLVLRAALGAQQRAGEAVGLLGPYARGRQQLPGSARSSSAAPLAERLGGRCRQRSGAPPSRQQRAQPLRHGHRAAARPAAPAAAGRGERAAGRAGRARA